MESKFGEGEAVVAWEGSTAEATQSVHTHRVVPKSPCRSVEVGQGVVESEAECVHLLGRSVHEDLDGLIVGEAGRRWLWFGGTAAGVATSVTSLPPHLPLTPRLLFIPTFAVISVLRLPNAPVQRGVLLRTARQRLQIGSGGEDVERVVM